MTARTVVADILLGAAVLVVLGSSVGVLVMRDVYAKLHYVTPVALLAPLLVGLAILAQSGWSVNSLQTWLTVAFMVIAAPYLTHATIRAARIRESGGWSSAPDDPGPENR
ncbi:MAG TPA: monovalent cation/H(+) antiporter subunit G [Streptosporangiaceae bacterium]